MRILASSLLAVLLLTLAGCGASEPPAPRITVNGQKVEAVLSTHCWKDKGCADYPNPPDLMAAVGYKPPEIVNAFPNMDLAFSEPPTEFTLSNWWEGRERTILSSANGDRIGFPMSVRMPDVKGVHTIALSGQWKNGSATWVFQYIVQ